MDEYWGDRGRRHRIECALSAKTETLNPSTMTTTLGKVKMRRWGVRDIDIYIKEEDSPRTKPAYLNHTIPDGLGYNELSVFPGAQGELGGHISEGDAGV